MRLATLLVSLAACSGGSSTQNPQRPLPPNGAPPDAAVAAHPTDAECTALITHVIDVGIAEQRAHARDAATAEAQAPTAEERAKLVAEVTRDWLPACRTLAPADVTCGVTAATSEAIAACQAMPSSSTSNSSVAPPGITPPAPAAP